MFFEQRLTYEEILSWSFDQGSEEKKILGERKITFPFFEKRKRRENVFKVMKKSAKKTKLSPAERKISEK